MQKRTEEIAPLLKSLLKTYEPYFPAMVILLGTVMLAIGFFMGTENQNLVETSNWLRLVGAFLAAAGAFWSGHQQVVTAQGIRQRDEKLLSMSEELRAMTTGGSSFCYARPCMLGGQTFQWMILHQGKYPLFDVNVRIYDFRRDKSQPMGLSYDLGTLYPGRGTLIPNAISNRTPAQAFNVFFVARNGSWTQTIRWTEVGADQKFADKVTDDQSHEVLRREVTTGYSSPTPENLDWPGPAGLIKEP